MMQDTSSQFTKTPQFQDSNRLLGSIRSPQISNFTPTDSDQDEKLNKNTISGLIDAYNKTARNIGSNYSNQPFGLLKQFESYRDKAYPDAGNYAIGFGRQFNDDGSRVRPDQTTNRIEEEQRFNNMIGSYAKPFSGLNLSPNQLDSLVSYSYNVGPNHPSVVNMVDKLKRGAPLSRNDFSVNTVKGQFNPGLDRRRNQEWLNFIGDNNG